MSVRKKDGYISIDGHYDIAFERIDTAEKVLGWIVHLTEKNWITKEHIERLIVKAASVNNIKIGYDA